MDAKITSELAKIFRPTINKIFLEIRKLTAKYCEIVYSFSAPSGKVMMAALIMITNSIPESFIAIMNLLTEKITLIAP